MHLPIPAHLNDISGQIIDSAMKVHTRLGPGLLESTYKICLAAELASRGYEVQVEVALPIVYENVKLDGGYRIDLLVEGSVIIEVKSVEEFHPVHKAQVLTYLKLSSLRVWLLLNFNVLHMKDGIQRLVL